MVSCLFEGNILLSFVGNLIGSCISSLLLAPNPDQKDMLTVNDSVAECGAQYCPWNNTTQTHINVTKTQVRLSLQILKPY